MWLFAKTGFYSIVETGPDQVQIRARAKVDLEKLRNEYLPQSTDIKTSYETDYPFRVFVSKKDWADAVKMIALDINYTNFKDSIHDIDPDRADIYLGVWSEALSITDSETRTLQLEAYQQYADLFKK